MNILDVFNSEPFKVSTLTAAINERPYLPGTLRNMGLFESDGINTLTVDIERLKGVLKLVPTSARGGPGHKHQGEKRTMKRLSIGHLQVDDFLSADEILGVREIGSATALKTLQAEVLSRAGAIADNFMMTRENWYMGAVNGKVMDADGTTELWNMFDEFGVTEPTQVDFVLGTDATKIKTLCNQVLRTIQTALGAAPYTTVVGLCGDNFFDKLHEHPAVKGDANSFIEKEQWSNLAGPWSYIRYGKILWINYRGADDGNGPSIATNKVRFFPVGVPGLFIERFGPADYVETVGTKGLPLYTRTKVAESGKGVDIEVQTNPIVLCTRPGVLVPGITSN